jgi:hypothetical protein
LYSLILDAHSRGVMPHVLLSCTFSCWLSFSGERHWDAPRKGPKFGSPTFYGHVESTIDSEGSTWGSAWWLPRCVSNLVVCILINLMALIWAEPLCDELLFGSALQQGRDIVADPERGQRLAFLHSRVMWNPL